MSSSPYQSRLFSFLNRQSLRLRDRLGKTTRHLKVAAEWGVQMLVYPVYLLVQTGRLFGQRLEKSAEYSQLPAQEDNKSDLVHPIPVDQPIEQVLSLIDPWVITNNKTLTPSSTPTVDQLSQHIQKRVQTVLDKRNQSNLVTQAVSQIQKVITGDNQHKLKIQGIASLLDIQKLVLVADNNQTFNVLSIEQQNLLEKRIRRELANYYYEKRLYKAVGQHFPSLIPQFTEKDQNVLPPIRWFWRTMRWVQTSDVAIALNVFGESSLINPPLNREIIYDNPDFPIGEWGEREKILVNKPIPSNKPDLSSLKSFIQSAINYFYGGLQKTPLANSQIVQQLPEASAIIQDKVKEKVIKPASAQLKQLKQQIYQQTEQPDPFRLQVIIEAAIAHFFPESSSPQIKPSSASQPEDPWLTPEDIFPQLLEAKSSDSQPISLPASPDLPPPSQVTTLPQKLSNLTQEILRPSEVKKTNKISQSSINRMISVKKTQSSFTEIEFSPDWIETEVKAVGYVQHPLEKLLKGLDKIILWLEEMIVKLLKTILKLWQK